MVSIKVVNSDVRLLCEAEGKMKGPRWRTELKSAVCSDSYSVLWIKRRQEGSDGTAASSDVQPSQYERAQTNNTLIKA